MSKSQRREGDDAGSTVQRWFWFVALWLLGVGAVSIVAFVIQAMILQ